MGCITLMTDFGSLDSYVGAMKGVILSLAPSAQIIDITHEIAPHNVVQAAFMLRHTWPWFPAGTVHVAVVDPGVGSKRRILLGRYGGQYVVAPDNGLISIVHHEMPIEELRVVDNPRLWLPLVSNTFHGRDIIAPVAARLAAGINPTRDFGPVTDRLEVLRIPAPVIDLGQAIGGVILYADRFGNLIANVRAPDLHRARLAAETVRVFLDGREIGPIQTCYADAAPGQALALFGSSDHLEIAVNQGSAAETLGAGEGGRVELRAVAQETTVRS